MSLEGKAYGILDDEGVVLLGGGVGGDDEGGRLGGLGGVAAGRGLHLAQLLALHAGRRSPSGCPRAPWAMARPMI